MLGLGGLRGSRMGSFRVIGAWAVLPDVWAIEAGLGQHVEHLRSLGIEDEDNSNKVYRLVGPFPVNVIYSLHVWTNYLGYWVIGCDGRLTDQGSLIESVYPDAGCTGAGACPWEFSFMGL